MMVDVETTPGNWNTIVTDWSDHSARERSRIGEINSATFCKRVNDKVHAVPKEEHTERHQIRRKEKHQRTGQPKYRAENRRMSYRNTA